MTASRNEQVRKKSPGAAALRAAAPGREQAGSNLQTLLPLIEALARDVFLELHGRELASRRHPG